MNLTDDKKVAKSKGEAKGDEPESDDSTEGQLEGER